MRRLLPTQLYDFEHISLWLVLGLITFVLGRRLLSHPKPPLQTRFGLVTVHEGKDPIVADIIAVHGLGAHPAYAWLGKLPDGRLVNWLADDGLLPKHVPNVRVMAFNYESRWHRDPIVTRTTVCANQLLKAVDDQRQKEPEVENRPIIILAHSFGGIVAEKAILQAISQKSDPITEFSLADTVTGIVLFGTPHRGTSAARLPYFFALVARYMSGCVEVSILRELSKDSLQLRDTLNEFASWAKRESISVFCFFEQKRTDYARKTGIPFLTWTGMVVDEGSAVIDGHACLGLPVDHLKLNKFAEPEDHNFKAVVSVVESFVGKGISLMHTRSNNSGCPKPVMLIPFLRDADFVGREASLSRVEEILGHAETGARAALVGIGGAGKSQVAIEHAYRTREKNKDISIFWVHASSPARFYASYASIAAELHLPGFDKPEASQLDLVQRWLASEASGEWLLILDNIDDPNFVHASHDANGLQQYEYTVSQYLPQRTCGAILATTRNREAAFGLVGKKDYMIDVDRMQDGEALSLLKKKTSQSNATQEELIELLTNLENIPLAITHAAAYISRRERMSVRKYIDLLQTDEDSSASLLSVEGNDLRRDPGVPNSVIRTWQMSFEQIKQQNELASDLLTSMCMFDKQSIPEYLLHDDTKAFDFEEAIEMLLSFAIITMEVQGHTFAMHRLVQLATRTWLRANGAFESKSRVALAMLAKHYPTGQFGSWGQCQALEPHADSVLRSGTQGYEERLLRARLLSNRAWYHMLQGRYPLAEDLAREGLDIRRSLLGEDHPDRMASMADVASVLSYQGRSADAATLQEQLMERYKKTLGEEHFDTLITSLNLSIDYMGQGRWDEAEKQSLQGIETSRRVLGEQHPRTLAFMSVLTNIYNGQKQWKEAEKLGVRVLEAQRRVLGDEHSETLKTMGRLGVTLGHSEERLIEAEELQMRVIETRRRLLGEEHPETLDSMINLANLYRRQGRGTEAEKLQVQAMEIRQKLLGEEHPDTLSSMRNLALTYQDQGRVTEAEKLHVQVLKGRRAILGDEHPATLVAMADFGYLYWTQGRLLEAEAQYERALEARRRVLGEEHPDTLAIMASLASLRQYLDEDSDGGCSNATQASSLS